MRALFLIALLAILPLAARATEDCPRSPGQSLSLPATRAAVLAGRPVTVVAFGSSSTEGAGASDQSRTYPAMLEAQLHAALPEAKLQVLNRGRGGEEVQEMLGRLEHDVLELKPTLVIWQAGANAVLRGMEPDAFSAALAGGIARLRARGMDVVLMDSQRAPRILASPNHGRFDMALHELSVLTHVPLFSRAALMRAWEEAGTPAGAMLAPDGLHHNDRGYACLARTLARSILDAVGPARIAGR
jgi:lysophospholipase L1-like esterase